MRASRLHNIFHQGYNCSHSMACLNGIITGKNLLVSISNVIVFEFPPIIYLLEDGCGGSALFAYKIRFSRRKRFRRVYVYFLLSAVYFSVFDVCFELVIPYLVEDFNRLCVHLICHTRVKSSNLMCHIE